MQLYIVRHGIAIDREDPKSPSDPERYLTPEGLRKTREVARGFASLKISPDVFLSSPYVRAVQTAEIFAEETKFSKSKIKQTDLLLPGADPAAFFRELQRTSRSEESAICFGHEPVPQTLTIRLTAPRPRRARLFHDTQFVPVPEPCQILTRDDCPILGPDPLFQDLDRHIGDPLPGNHQVVKAVRKRPPTRTRAHVLINQGSVRSELG